MPLQRYIIAPLVSSGTTYITSEIGSEVIPDVAEEAVNIFLVEVT